MHVHRGSTAARIPSQAGPLLVAAAALAGCVVLLLADPRSAGTPYPVCPFLAITGRWCPGCGTLRASRELLEADVVGALGYNAPFVLALPVLAYAWTGWLARTQGRRRPAGLRFSPRVAWGVVTGLVVFWVVRNLPGFAFLAP